MRVILDTDPGVDDSIAMLWLLALDARFRADIVGITTTEGNLSRRGTFDNAAKLLEHCLRSDLVLAKSAPHPGAHAQHIHGDDGLAGCRQLLPESNKEYDEAPLAPQQIVRWLNREKGDITIIAIGPVTNLAAAEALQPGVLKLAKKIVIMGGAFQRGNVTEKAEFNVHFNAPAFHNVINSGAETILIPLDITRQLVLDKQTLENIVWDTTSQRIARFFLKTSTAMIEHIQTKTDERHFFVHDACAIAYAFYSQWFETVEAHVSVDVRGNEEDLGKTTINKDGLPNVTVLRRMDGDLVRLALLEDIRRFSEKLR